jgi:hypothetical protein
MAQNPSLSTNIDVFHQVRERSMMGKGVKTRISSHSGELIKIVTIDEFVQKHKLSVGFLKGDVE